MNWRSEAFKRFIENILIIVFAALVVRTFVVSPYQVPSNMMQPTLLPGDIVIGYRLPFGVRLPFTQEKFFQKAPQLGDVVVYRSPDHPRISMVRRVVAAEGDRVSVQGGMLWVNGNKSPFNSEQFKADFSLKEFIVPRDEIFVLADLRSESAADELKTRAWSTVPVAKVEARVLGIWTSVEWSGIGRQSRLRTDRILSAIN